MIFQLLLKAGSNPADINKLRSLTGKRKKHSEKKDILAADHLQINKLADSKHCFREGENNCRIINN